MSDNARPSCKGPRCERRPLDGGAWCAEHAITWGAPVLTDAQRQAVTKGSQS